jgi:DUF1365 family protein
VTLRSALYVGTVRHRRREPAHAFEFPLFMTYLDLAEIDRVLALTRWCSASRFAPIRYRRADFLGDPATPLRECVLDVCARDLGRRPDGPVRMLTHLRTLGYSFNPVTFYYCFRHDPGAPEGETLDAIVAEITNTPWGERHAYALDARTARVAHGVHRWRFAKEFHVSPFLPMDLGYDWSFGVPGDGLFVHMTLREEGLGHRASGIGEGEEDGAWKGPAPIGEGPAPTGQGPAGAGVAGPRIVFDATMRMRREPISAASLRGVALRFPAMTLRVITRIYWEALRLRLKGARVYPHPGTLRAPRAEVLA